jgi:hypothetical protein
MKKFIQRLEEALKPVKPTFQFPIPPEHVSKELEKPIEMNEHDLIVHMRSLTQLLRLKIDPAQKIAVKAAHDFFHKLYFQQKAAGTLKPATKKSGSYYDEPTWYTAPPNRPGSTLNRPPEDDYPPQT